MLLEFTTDLALCIPLTDRRRIIPNAVAHPPQWIYKHDL